MESMVHHPCPPPRPGPGSPKPLKYNSGPNESKEGRMPRTAQPKGRVRREHKKERVLGAPQPKGRVGKERRKECRKACRRAHRRVHRKACRKEEDGGGRREGIISIETIGGSMDGGRRVSPLEDHVERETPQPKGRVSSDQDCRTEICGIGRRMPWSIGHVKGMMEEPKKESTLFDGRMSQPKGRVSPGSDHSKRICGIGVMIPQPGGRDRVRVDRNRTPPSLSTLPNWGGGGGGGLTPLVCASGCVKTRFSGECAWNHAIRGRTSAWGHAIQG